MPRPWHNWYHCMSSTFGQWLPGDGRGFRTRHHRQHIEGDYKAPPPKGKYDEWLARSKKNMNRPPVWLPESARAQACKRIAEALHYYEVEFVDLCVTATHFHVLARFSPCETVDPMNPPTGVGGLSQDIMNTHYPWDKFKDQIETMPGYYTDDDEPESEKDKQSSSAKSPPTPVGGSPPTSIGGLSPAHHRKDGLDPHPRYLIGKTKSWASRHVKAAGLLSCTGGLFAKRGKIVPIASRQHQLAVVRYIRHHITEGGIVYSLMTAT